MLTTLCLEKNPFDEDDMIHLVSALENHITLKTLILSRNEIGPFNTKHLANVIQNNTVF